MKGWAGAVRDAARPKGWSARQGHIVRLDDGIVSKVYEFAGSFRLFAFPVTWNETLWRLLGLTCEPLTRHATTLSVPCPLLQARAFEMTDVTAAAGTMIDFAESARGRVAGDWLHDLTEQKARSIDLGRPDDFTLTEAIWHLVNGRTGEAREVARDVLAGRRRASVTINGANNANPFQIIAAHPAEGAL